MFSIFPSCRPLLHCDPRTASGVPGITHRHDWHLAKKGVSSHVSLLEGQNLPRSPTTSFPFHLTGQNCFTCFYIIQLHLNLEEWDHMISLPSLKNMEDRRMNKIRQRGAGSEEGNQQWLPHWGHLRENTFWEECSTVYKCLYVHQRLEITYPFTGTSKL